MITKNQSKQYAGDTSVTNTVEPNGNYARECYTYGVKLT